ncbi:hypothetical protein D9619_008449 [Psilocybe cf. subviscida]|uniref:DNA polymerase epsilon subunit D n=1 Tax=Psilocybe cf. subviscida TaxID=2480587 RepID=A0A8H5B9K2_9AGAR|nr:hypothetical protein D9619_008449 [Psilocybe cf. subviscida]
MPRKDASAGPISAQAQQDLVTEGIENFELPKSVVMKIAKSSLPDNIKLQKETVLSLVKGSTVFINYLAATAHDVALSKQHKSISAADVLKALETIEFADMANKLQGELNIYRELQKNEPAKGKKSNGSASARRPSGTGASASTAAGGASASVGGIASASASTAAKGKGKDKALLPGMALPPPFTSAPLNRPSGPTAPANPNAMDVDDEDASISRAQKSTEEEEGLVDPDEIEEDEVMDEEEAGSEEEEVEVEDTVAAEERELLEDARGVEERGAAMDDD